MEGLDKLSLDDLDFTGDTTFETNTASAEELAKLSKDKDDKSGTDADDNKDNDSDDKKVDKDGNPIIPGQESVANDKDNTSSGGKTPSAKEDGSNSN